MKQKDGRKKQARVTEEYTIKELKQSYAPCEVVKLTEEPNELNGYIWSLKKDEYNQALKKLFKKDTNKINYFKEKFETFLQDAKTKEISEIAGLPDLIVITNNDFFFVEVKSHHNTPKSEQAFLQFSNRKPQENKKEPMRVNENQRPVFQKIAQKYKLYFCEVILDENDKLLSILMLPYENVRSIINHSRTTNMLGLPPEELRKKAFEAANPEIQELLLEFEKLTKEDTPKEDTPKDPIHVITTAPNKIIITGEHAVVFGCPAISTSINSETQIEIKTKIRPSSLTLHQNKKTYHFNQDLQPNINYPEKWIYEHTNLWKQILLTYKLYQEFKDLNLSIDVTVTPSNLPKGTGNSAAIASATILAIHTLLGRTLCKEELFNEIQKFEHKGEVAPSGIDARTVISDKPLIFQKHFNPEKYEYKEIDLTLPKQTTLLLIDTTNLNKPNAKTHEQVEKFAKATKGNAQKIKAEFEPIVQAIQKELTKTGNAQRLGELFNENHALLRKYNVSCEDTEKIIQKVLTAGALGVKITGAGGQNGAIIALTWTKDVDKIRKKLKTQKTWQINFPTQGTHLQKVE